MDQGITFEDAAKIIQAEHKRICEKFRDDDERRARIHQINFEILTSPDVGNEKTAFHMKGSRCIKMLNSSDCYYKTIPRRFHEYFRDGHFYGSEGMLHEIAKSLAERPYGMCSSMNAKRPISEAIVALWYAAHTDNKWKNVVHIQVLKRKFDVCDLLVHPESGKLRIYTNQGKEVHKMENFMSYYHYLHMVGQLFHDMSINTMENVDNRSLGGYIYGHAKLFQQFGTVDDHLSDGSSMKIASMPPDTITKELENRLRQDSFVELMKNIVYSDKNSGLDQFLKLLAPDKFKVHPIPVKENDDFAKVFVSKKRARRMNGKGLNVNNLF